MAPSSSSFSICLQESKLNHKVFLNGRGSHPSFMYRFLWRWQGSAEHIKHSWWCRIHVDIPESKMKVLRMPCSFLSVEKTDFRNRPLFFSSHQAESTALALLWLSTLALALPMAFCLLLSCYPQMCLVSVLTLLGLSFTCLLIVFGRVWRSCPQLF